MINKIKFRANKYNVTFITLFFPIVIVGGYYMPVNNIYQHINLMGWIGWGLLLWSIGSWFCLFNEIFCANNIFLGVAYLFTFSQSLLLPLNIVPDQRNLLNIIDPDTFLKAQCYTLVCLSFYFIGCVWGGKKSGRIEKNFEGIFILKSIKKIGLILLIISAIPFAITIIEKINIVNQFGYSGIFFKEFSRSGLNAVLKNIADYFHPAMICLLIASTYDIWKQKIIYFLFAIVILIQFFVGGRSEAVTIILLILLYRHYYVSPLKGMRVFFYSVIGFIFMGFMSTVAELRGEIEKNFVDYIYAFGRGVTIDNLAILTICEMGSSMFPLAKTMQLVPDSYPFRGGATYLYAFSSIIPNLNFWDIHPAMTHANLGDWLQKAFFLNSNPGYSLVAEAYLNWGWFGFIFFIIQGLVNGRILSLATRKNARSNPDLFCFVLIILFFTLISNRNSFLSTIRAFFYFGIPILMMIRFYSKNIRRKMVRIYGE